jgi:hypothetical protein
LDEDEGLTLKYKMIQLATISKDCLNKLQSDWTEFSQVRLLDIKKGLHQLKKK